MKYWRWVARDALELIVALAACAVVLAAELGLLALYTFVVVLVVKAML